MIFSHSRLQSLPKSITTFILGVARMSPLNRNTVIDFLSIFDLLKLEECPLIAFEVLSLVNLFSVRKGLQICWTDYSTEEYYNKELKS
jgi:hypothetical protein